MRGLAVVLLAIVASGCESYSAATEAARRAFYAGELERSVELWSELLSGGQRETDRPLMLLERGLVQFAAGRYDAAARDLNDADQQLEVMDFTSDPAEVGRYLFSEDSGLYRGPPHEKILVPTMLSLAFSAMGDTERARTAANAAYSQLQRFDALEAGAEFGSPLALILIGLAAEAEGDTQRAHIAISKAYELRPTPALQPVLLRLTAENARRFGGHWVSDFEAARRAWGDAPSPSAEHGELVVVVLNGRAPIKVQQKRGLDAEQKVFLVDQAMFKLQEDQPDADMVEAQQLFEDQQFLPMAVVRERPSRFDGGALVVPGGATLPLEGVLPVGRQCTVWFEQNESRLVTAALSRLAFRLAVRVGIYLATKKENEDSQFALILALTAGEILRMADTPDTRCWSLLPRDVLFQRAVLPAGPQQFEIEMSGGGDRMTLARDVEITAGGTTFAVFVVPD